MNSRCVKIGKDENICDTLDHSFGSYAALSVCVFACLGGKCWTALFYTTQIGHIGVIWDAKILDTLSTLKFLQVRHAGQVGHVEDARTFGM